MPKSVVVFGSVDFCLAFWSMDEILDEWPVVCRAAVDWACLGHSQYDSHSVIQKKIKPGSKVWWSEWSEWSGWSDHVGVFSSIVQCVDCFNMGDFTPTHWAPGVGRCDASGQSFELPSSRWAGHGWAIRRQFERGPKWKVRSFPKSQMGARSSWEAGIMCWHSQETPC